MNRIDEIKERMNNRFNSAGIVDIEENAIDDIEFLLQKLENAQRHRDQWQEEAIKMLDKNKSVLSLNERMKLSLEKVVNAYDSEGTDIEVARRMVNFAKQGLEEKRGND